MTGKRKTTRTDKVDEAAFDETADDFDREFIVDSFSTPTAEAKKRFERAKRKPGRPRVGAGSKRISVTMEKSLLVRVDRLARKKKTTRAALIARALRKFLSRETAGSGSSG